MKVIEITKRKCSDKVQPNIKVGGKYVVDSEDVLKDGTKVLVLLDLRRSTKDKAKRVRCNASRFCWQEFTEEKAREIKFRQECKKSYEEILNSFTFEEHMKIAFLPHVILYCIWDYAEMTRIEAALSKIEVTRKLSRAVRMLSEEYEKEIAKDLDTKHRKQINQQGEMFRRGYGDDFTKLEEAIEAEVRRVAPDDPHTFLRVYAYAGMLLYNYYVKYSAECDRMIEQRLGKDRETILNPKIVALNECLDAYTGTVEIDISKKSITDCVDKLVEDFGEVHFKLGKETIDE